MCSPAWACARAHTHTHTHTHTHGCRAWLNFAYHGQRKWRLCYLWQQMTELSRQLFSLGTSTEFATCHFLQCLPEQPHPAFTHVIGKARVLSAPLWTCHSNLESPSEAQFCQELGVVVSHVIPALRRLQAAEDQEFKARLSYAVNSRLAGFQETLSKNKTKQNH